MSFKISFIGAGSTVFMKNIAGDILHNPPFKNAMFSLHDIDEKRLEESTLVVQKLAKTLGADITLESTLNRHKSLEGADFVIVMIQVGGYKPSTVIDFEIPKKYGLRQTIADTLGIGGIMRALRTVPVLIDICNDMREICPQAIMLNYVNPMAINSWAISRMAPDINYIGLCHSVQGTAEILAQDIGVDINKLTYDCAGINHMAFFTKFMVRENEHSLKDIYPLLRSFAQNEDNIPKDNKVRYEIMRQFGYFVTESSEHFAEYCPWFIKQDRHDLIEAFNIPLDEYPRRCEEQIEQWEKQAKEYRESNTISVAQSHEYAATILNAFATHEPAVVYGNVPNNGLIDNLPQGCSVELACFIDRNGIQPKKFGSLPPQLAALMQTNINVQSLIVAALEEENKNYIYHAAMLDPHTAAELDLRQIRQLVDDLIHAHKEWLPSFAQ